MNIDYATSTPEQLLAALEQAGRTPDRALLQACLEREHELIPGLLEMLASGVDYGWEEEDPRWFREVHAGLLLIAFREERALPFFMEIYRDEERETLAEWFTPYFWHYGPPAVDPLIDLFRERKADVWTRISAGEMLKDIGLHFPETRDRIVETLRAPLPRLDESGAFVIPPRDEDDRVEFWTFVLLDLAQLKDTDSRAQGVALYKAGLVDEMVMGDVGDYLAIFDEAQRERDAFDLIRRYYPTPRLRPASREPVAPDGEGASAGAPFVHADRKVGRNEPCPCGSGRKYKRCCGR